MTDLSKQIADLEAELEKVKAAKAADDARWVALAKDCGVASTKVAHRLYEVFDILEEFTTTRVVKGRTDTMSTDKDGELRAQRALLVLNALHQTADWKEAEPVARAHRAQEAERQQRRAEREEKAARAEGKKAKPMTKDQPSASQQPPAGPAQQSPSHHPAPRPSAA